MSTIIGAVIGGLIGTLVQLSLFRETGLQTRLADGQHAAAGILDDVHFAIEELPKLKYSTYRPVPSAGFNDRCDSAHALFDRLRRAEFVSAPVLTDKQLAARFYEFVRRCSSAIDPDLDSSYVVAAVEEATQYGQHLQKCLDSYLGVRWPWRAARLPAEPSATASADSG